MEAYWKQLLATLPAASPIRDEQYIAERFEDTPDFANRLAALLLNGIKTATCSAVWEWAAENKPLPEVGLKTTVLNGNHEPQCIIETSEVTMQAYNDIDAEWAAAEGEGDRTLEYWQKAHANFFARTLPKLGLVPTLDMPLVCERFRIIFGPAGMAGTS